MTIQEQQLVYRLKNKIKVLSKELEGVKNLNNSIESIYDQKILEKDRYISDLQKENITLTRQYSLAQSHITVLSTGKKK